MSNGLYSEYQHTEERERPKKRKRERVSNLDYIKTMRMKL